MLRRHRYIDPSRKRRPARRRRADGTLPPLPKPRKPRPIDAGTGYGYRNPTAWCYRCGAEHKWADGCA